MPSKVTQTFVGDASQLNRELDKLRRDYARLEEQQKKAADQSGDSARQTHEQMSALDRQAEAAANKISSVVTAYASWETAIGLVTNALQEQRQLERENLTTQEQLARAQGDLVRNMGADISAVNEQLRVISQQTNVQMAPLTMAASAAVSAKGTLSTEAAMQAVAASAALSRDQPEQIQTYTGAALDIMRVTGITDPREALGFAQTGAAAARITTAPQFFGNIAPVVGGAQNLYPQQDPVQAARESAALFTTLTAVGADPTGESSRTAAIQYIGQLRQFWRERSAETGAEIPQGILGQLQAIQRDPELRAAFTGDLTGEQRFIGAFEALADPQSTASRQFRQVLAGTQFSAAPYEERVAALGTATPQLRIAEATRARQTAMEQYTLADSERAAQAQVRDILEQGMSVGGGWLSRLGGTLDMWLGYDAEMAAAGIFSSDPTASAISSARRLLTERRRDFEIGGVQPDEREAVTVLTKLLGQLEELNRNVSRTQTGDLGSAAQAQAMRHVEN